MVCCTLSAIACMLLSIIRGWWDPAARCASPIVPIAHCRALSPPARRAPHPLLPRRSPAPAGRREPRARQPPRVRGHQEVGRHHARHPPHPLPGATRRRWRTIAVRCVSNGWCTEQVCVYCHGSVQSGTSRDEAAPSTGAQVGGLSRAHSLKLHQISLCSTIVSVPPQAGTSGDEIVRFVGTLSHTPSLKPYLTQHLLLLRAGRRQPRRDRPVHGRPGWRPAGGRPGRRRAAGGGGRGAGVPAHHGLRPAAGEALLGFDVTCAALCMRCWRWVSLTRSWVACAPPPLACCRQGAGMA